MPPLIEGIALDGLIAGRTFNSIALVAELGDRGAKVVISRPPGRTQKLRIGTALHAWRHLIDKFFHTLK